MGRFENGTGSIACAEHHLRPPSKLEAEPYPSATLLRELHRARNVLADSAQRVGVGFRERRMMLRRPRRLVDLCSP